MTATAYLLGAVLCCIVLGSLGLFGCSVRRTLLPEWRGAPARLAEAVIAIAALVLIGEMLGTAGYLRRWPLVGCCVALALAATLIARRVLRSGARSTVPQEEAPSGTEPPSAVVLAGFVVILFLLLLPWTYTTLNAVHHGIREYDSLSYHLPFAARFAQTGSTTGLQFMGNPPVSFYPMNSELIHAAGMLLFRRDVLSLVINFGWLALALVAGWCIGRTRGIGFATLAATALVLSTRVVAFSQGGTAKNDVMSISLLLASIALLSQRRPIRGETIVAALAAGLAVGTRLTLWAPALALALIVIVTSPRGRRLAVTGTWLIGILAGCGYWYARNLAQVGNPFPWVGGSLAGIVTLPSTSPPVDCGTRAIAHYLPHPGFLAAHVVPQLDPFLGRLWWIVVGLAVLGIVTGLLSRSAPSDRALAVVALVAGVAYLFTPATGGGTDASCFGFNTRFLVPALMLGTILVPLWLARLRAPQLFAILASAVVIAVDAHIPLTFTPVLVSALVAGGVGLLAAFAHRGVSRAAFLAVTAVVGLIAVAAGWEIQRIYYRGRYTQPRLQQPVDSAAMVLRHVSDARIAVTGFFETYPLDGVSLSNRVVVPAVRVGARFRADVTCRAWLAALERGHYNYAVTALQGTSEPAAAAWTRRLSGARELRSASTTRAGQSWYWEVFSLPRRVAVDPGAACA